jgi:hypothetical protein
MRKPKFHTDMLTVLRKMSMRALIFWALLLSKSAIAQIDSDSDGVNDSSDLCPSTPIGTVVNSYGCPITVTNCDYNTSSFTLVSTMPPNGMQTKYILADAADGKIIQISSTPTFTNLVGSKTYMAVAYSFEDNGTIVNLNVGSFLSQVNATCDDWSNALPLKVCAPFIDNGTCDFTSSSFSLKTIAPTPSGSTTKYLLVNQNGTIVKISDTPNFVGISGINSYNAYALSYTGNINNLSLGSNFSSVNGSCLDWSQPLSLKVCVCEPICILASIVKIK